MRYETVERDFVSRSLALLQQYDKYVRPHIASKESYEVTLLLNALLGLVVLPFEQKKRLQGNPKFPIICDGDEIQISQLSHDWGLDRISIIKFNLDGKPLSKEEITLRKIVAMFRHCMAHSQFENGCASPKPKGLSVNYQPSEVNPIESIILKVNFVNEYKNYKHQVEFEATISVEGLRMFATTLAKIFLSETESKS
jgi:hypothetical protein